MATLKSKQVESLMETTRALHACRDEASFAKVAVEAMTRMIRADRAELQLYRATHDLETLYRDHPLPGDEERESRFLECMLEHPIVEHTLTTGHGGPHLLSDFVSQRTWRQTRLYVECCREAGDNHLLCVSATVEPGLELSLSLNRRLTAFSEQERLLLGLTKNHLAQAWENVRQPPALEQQIRLIERGMDAPGRAVMLIDDRGRIKAASRRAVDLLARHFPGWRGAAPPASLATWLAEQRRRAGGLATTDRRRGRLGAKSDVATSANDFQPPKPFRLVTEQSSLTIWLHPECKRTNAPAMLSLEQRSPADDAAKLQSLGLTPRQAQTLFWIAQGQSNREIANILSVRPRTVDKFAEAVFSRLGVDNRLAAALCAQEALRNAATFPS